MAAERSDMANCQDNPEHAKKRARLEKESAADETKHMMSHLAGRGPVRAAELIQLLNCVAHTCLCSLQACHPILEGHVPVVNSC